MWVWPAGLGLHWLSGGCLYQETRPPTMNMPDRFRFSQVGGCSSNAGVRDGNNMGGFLVYRCHDGATSLYNPVLHAGHVRLVPEHQATPLEHMSPGHFGVKVGFSKIFSHEKAV